MDLVVQNIGKPDFEDGLRMVTTVVVITDSHSVCTNPEVSVRPMARCGRFTAVRRGHKTQSLQLLDQFLSKSMDQSPTLPCSAQSLVLTYCYYCGCVVRIELA